MNCEVCGSPLMIADSDFVSELNSSDVYSELTMVCINPKCDSYCGNDLNNPKKVAKKVKNKVNRK